VPGVAPRSTTMGLQIREWTISVVPSRIILMWFRLRDRKLMRLRLRLLSYSLNQCFGYGSGSTWIRIQLVAWIRIRNADPDPGGLKKS
jgi:hypothetical protein